MKRPSLRSALLLLHCLGALSQAAVATTDSTDVAKTVAVTPEKSFSRNFHALATHDSLYLRADPVIVFDGPVTDSLLARRNRAHALLEQVVNSQRFLETLDATSEIALPVGVVKAGGTVDYSILIDRIQFTKEGAVMDVYVSLALPQTGSRIAFHGVVPLSAEGGIAGNARVYLLGDHPMKLSNRALVRLKGTDKSYVEFDCGGFLGIHLDAEIEFSTDLIVPENAQGEILQERLKVSFSTYTQSLHDIIGQVTMPPFQLKGLPGFGFHVAKAYLDWSDLSNPPAIVFPPAYASPVIKAGLPDLWQGIYIQELAVRLPAAFAKRTSATRVAVGARQMIIDDQGLTGALYAENVITDGDMSGWTYSLDKLSFEIVTNQVAGLALEGLLSIPVVKAQDGTVAQFKYIAQREAAGNYAFAVQIEDALKLDLWLADLSLHKNSSVIVAEKSNKFFPSAHLSGELSFNFVGKGPKPKFNSIRFEKMVISSEAPYFQPGTFAFGSEGQNASISKYPVVIDKVKFESDHHRVGLAFDLIVNISGKPEDESFAGKGGLIIWGYNDIPRKDSIGNVIGIDRHNWKFDRIEMTSLKINVNRPKIIELAGEVRFFDDDATYGDGFKGSLKGKIHTIGVDAMALFGRTENFRYWFADALVALKTGIPIVPGVLSAFGFGGGYYSRMKQGVSSGSVTLGRTPSGITYIPDENAIGIRAIVLIGTPRPEAMTGDVSLEVSLNRHGGINAVTLSGNANFMSAATMGKAKIQELALAAVSGSLTQKLESLSRGQVYGSVRLHFDNINDVFHGNLEIYVNVAGGIVRGVGAGNKAGWAVLHFEKDNWYIHIGTPDQPLGLEVARIFKSKSYFMLGKNLPGSPPPPPQVAEILGNIDLDYMRDMNALESGMGIAFGLHFLVDTGDLRFLMFYGRFSAGTGLDFMLKDYGNDYHCAGSSGAIGINGWYANGQAYAFVTGKIGIKVNLRFYKGTYDILSIGAAAILQAKGPNPFWMKGTVGGHYRILGGLVKGKCKFDITVGTECKPVREENLLEDVNMIAGISPADNASGVSVLNAPQLAFNIPVGEVFEITDIENKKHFFRAVLDEFVLLSGYLPVKGVLEWNAEKDVVAFDAADLLAGNRKFKARARLTFEERINGIWRKVKFDGKIVTETAETNFETGAAPDHIHPENIIVAYPQPGQVNFHPGEHTSGFIQLRDGQPYLFNPDSEWIQQIRFSTAHSGETADVDFVYHSAERRIEFSLPQRFTLAAPYTMSLVNIPKHRTAVDENVQSIHTALDLDESAGNATLTTQTIAGQLDKLEIKTLYSQVFRTSRYHTFREKMRDVRLRNANRFTLAVNVFQLAAYLQGPEHFDGSEISTAPSDHTFITLEAVTEGNAWFERHVYPLVYEGYPLLGWMRISRINPLELGIPPVRDVFMVNGSSTSPLNSHNADVGSIAFSNEYIAYNLGESVSADFRDLQHHAVNYAVDHPASVSPRLQALITKSTPYIRHGSYKIRLTYQIPGLNKKTSSYEMEVYNPIRDND